MIFSPARRADIRIWMSLPNVAIRIQAIPIQRLTPIILRSVLALSYYKCSGFLNYLISSSFPNRIFNAFLVSPINYTWAAYHNSMNLIVLITFRKEHNFYKFPLNFLSTLFWNSIIQSFSLTDRQRRQPSWILLSIVEVDRRFRSNIGPSSKLPEDVFTSQMSENFYEITWENIPEDRHLHTSRLENLELSHDKPSFIS